MMISDKVQVAALNVQAATNIPQLFPSGSLWAKEQASRGRDDMNRFKGPRSFKYLRLIERLVGMPPSGRL